MWQIWVLYHYIGGDYRFTSYNYVTCINVMSRLIVMLARGVMYDIRQSRTTRKLSDWRGVPEISAGELVCGTSWLIELGSRFQSERMCFR